MSLRRRSGQRHLGGAMAEARVKGWCPGVWRPMASGDGLLVRVRPAFGALNKDKLLALCTAARRWGSGMIELTNRGNIQLRGVAEDGWPGLMAELERAGLVDKTPEQEARRNIMVVPDWQPGDRTEQITSLLLDRLEDLPELPAKMGFAIDAGERPILVDESADFRVECTADGQLLVRADGRTRGTPVDSPEAAVDLLIGLAHWFVDSGGLQAGRMRSHQLPLPGWVPEQAESAVPRLPLALGAHQSGAVYGLCFGQAEARILENAVAASNVSGIRVTPWRRFLVLGASGAPVNGLLSDNQAPELSIDACPGSPHCEQATVQTRNLARTLAGSVAGRLHVSGCSKGCARRQPTETCVVGDKGRYSLVFHGRADGTPDVSGLTASQLCDYFGV